MELEIIVAVGLLIGLSAILYSSVGHGGGSGYLAVMALFSVTTEVMRPTALVLNIAVAAIGFAAFYRRGAFSWRVLWPFAVTAVPMAFVGGLIHVPGVVYKPLLAAVLIYSAGYLFWPKADPADDPGMRPPVLPALAIGAFVGLLSGVTGIGGGIFLSPILLFRRWADTKTTAGVAAAFILLNSASGLAGQLQLLDSIPLDAIAVWVPLAVLGGFLGSRYGSRTPRNIHIQRLLGVVLLVAAGKMLLTIGD
ncbi:sulfite exporter TauE/SafE family protein [Tessaracoccus flavus]|uniref:Probable membrane transporter protein n=1 Tax=Tessaracoccus flavus TaxID=1610493 RepID=A0A1Q2CCP7_9ACTN|nr:sulfite exporter TauE/SafE family protein [Tessaracoccus flavus]AQP43871.1 hypothetical protein RPIT_02775 [Tessaracoccus flavus]SDY26892.1 hypothetical protein SAMN05428934_101155 [Tessaracoccus flavus]